MGDLSLEFVVDYLQIGGSFGVKTDLLAIVGDSDGLDISRGVVLRLHFGLRIDSIHTFCSFIYGFSLRDQKHIAFATSTL